MTFRGTYPEQVSSSGRTESSLEIESESVLS